MLKYICVVFCIISLSDSTPDRQVGHYHQLIFAQRWPMTALLEQYSLFRVGDKSTLNLRTNVMQYMINSLDVSNWVIYGLWPIKFYGTPPIFCTNFLSNSLTYHPDNLTASFKSELKIKWPVFRYGEAEDYLWANQYNTHGSCVNPTPVQYFGNAVRLLATYNVGSILTNAGIVPGNSYLLIHIVNAIKSVLGVRPYVMCLPAENRKEQYLLEVHICFHRRQNLISCTYPNADLCQRGKKVIYLPL